MYYVYILYSPQLDRYYIGQTYSLETRLSRHKLGTTRYTKRADDWELYYQESFSTRAEAMAREREIKARKSRKYIQSLINK